MIVQAIHARLRATPSVLELLESPDGTVRAFPGLAPQAAAYPLIVLTVVEQRHLASMHEPRLFAEATVQVDAYAETYEAADGLASQARRALHGQVFVAGGVDVQRCLLVVRRDMQEGTTPGSATRPLHRVSMDFDVAFEES